MAKIKNTRTGTPSEATKHLQKYILQQKQLGISFQDIAADLDFSVAYVYKQYTRALKTIIYEDVEDLRKLEIARLEKLRASLMIIFEQQYPMVSGGAVVRDTVDDENGVPTFHEDTQNLVTVKLLDNGPRLAAADRILRVSERLSRLTGMDMPVKTAMTDPSGEKEASYVQFYLPRNGRDEDAGSGADH